MIKYVESNKTNVIASILFLLMFLLICNVNLFAQYKTDIVGFKITTSTPHGNFSPKNIGAIWIEDSNGKFIKTLKVWAERRKKYLYTWTNKSSGNTVDAVTSATLSAHQMHQITWDLKDANGMTVPNGEYTLHIEITDQHAQGPLAAFSFPVGDSSNVLVFPDESYFHEIQLYWNSTTTNIFDADKFSLNYSLSNNFPNPFNPTTTISYSIPEKSFVNLSVYNIKGEKIKILVSEEQMKGNYFINFDALNLKSGVYFYSIVTKGFMKTKKMILLR